MKFFIKLIGAVGLIFAVVAPGIPAYAAEPGVPQDFASGYILVKYDEDTDEINKLNVQGKNGDNEFNDIAPLGVRVVKVPAGSEQDKAASYRKDNTVEFAEPDYIAKAIDTPNDPYFSNQWGLQKIQAPQAWTTTSGSSSVKIAILDTGVDTTHPDLAAKVVSNRNETTSSTASDKNGHGTHVAGIAAGITDNGVGTAGVGYNSALMNVKVLDDNGSGQYSWIASGIIWAADNGAKVINMSLGAGSPSTTLKSAIDYAWNKGVVIVAAAGNDASTAPSYPAAYSNVISVAATDRNDAMAGFSNYGNWVTIAAPGANIYSTLPTYANEAGGTGYGYLSGTSMASPFVAGLAGLVWSTQYGTSNTNVRARIQSSADQISGTGTYWKYGRINAYKAVQSTASPAPPPSTPPSDTTPPGQVTGLTATTVGSSRLNLTWNANAASDFNHYNVYRSVTSGSGYSLVASPKTNAYADTGLTANTKYYYAVTAVDNTGNEGVKSAEAPATTGTASLSVMHVRDVSMSLQNYYSYYARALATVTIVDGSGKTVPNARVTGQWSGTAGGAFYGYTNSSGQLTFPSYWTYADSGKTFNFTVTGAQLSGWTYDSASNAETSASITIP